jgi:hypothetical protein
MANFELTGGKPDACAFVGVSWEFVSRPPGKVGTYRGLARLIPKRAVS